tara:strand:+ start:6602 stop:7456 length:855 start_codon:yes stop_codon:yes gene_type:complete
MNKSLLDSAQDDTVDELTESTRAESVRILTQTLHQASESENSKFWPAIHAAEALSSAGYFTEVKQTLTPLLKTDTNHQHRCGLAREVARAGDRSHVHVMLDILAGEETSSHVHACESLFSVNERGDGKLLRTAMLQTQNPIKAIMAAGAFARQEDSSAFALLREHLQGADPLSRQIAAWVLSYVGERCDIPALESGLEQATAPVERAYFVHTLAALGEEAAQQELIRNFSSENATVRAYAAFYAHVAKLDSACDLLVELLNDPAVDVRVRAAHSLLASQQRPQI